MSWIFFLLGAWNCGWGVTSRPHCENVRIPTAALSQDLHHALHWAECSRTHSRKHQLPSSHCILVSCVETTSQQFCTPRPNASFLDAWIYSRCDPKWYPLLFQQHLPCVETCQVPRVFLRMAGVYLAPCLHWEDAGYHTPAEGQWSTASCWSVPQILLLDLKILCNFRLLTCSLSLILSFTAPKSNSVQLQFSLQ